MGQTAILDSLRAHIAQIEGVTTRHPVLPFGVHAIDRHIPGGGIATGALHEVAGSATLADDAAATIFLAGVLARLFEITLHDHLVSALARSFRARAASRRTVTRSRDLRRGWRRYACADRDGGMSAPYRARRRGRRAQDFVADRLAPAPARFRADGRPGLRVPPFIAGRCEWRRHRGDDTLASARRAERAARDTRARASALVGRTRTRARRGG